MVGEIVSHYKIIELLGGGGMGIVYKAHDLKLERFVALKFLPPVLSFNAEFKNQIVQEAKIAATIDHSNICNIHEVGETDDGQIYIAMAFYEGETLKAKIEKNKLDLKDVESIILQIAKGLDVAHEKGIVHRDIKPANIFITNNNDVKILDFGVAKIDGDFSDMDAEKVKGTIAYMSPEQINGQDVDQRSDIWSFGVLLYELLTTKKPFNSKYQESALYSILHDEPDLSEISVGPELSYVKKLVQKCLKKNKEERFQSFSEMFSFIISTQPNFEIKKPSFKKIFTYAEIKKYWYLIIFSLLLGCTIIVWYISGSKNTALNSVGYILVSNFKNNTNDDVFDYSISEAMAITLRQSAYFNVFPRDRIVKTLSLMEIPTNDKIDDNLAIQIGKREGIPFVVSGEINKTGENYIITAGLVNVKSSEKISIHMQKVARIENILTSIDELALKIREDLGESAQSISKTDDPLAQVTTSSIKALNLYSRGDYLEANGKYNESIILKEKALAIDSLFVIAINDLSYNYSKIGNHEKAMFYHNKVLPKIDRVSEREKLQILTVYYGPTFEMEYKKANEYAQQWSLLYPQDPFAHLTLAHLSMFTGNYKEAIQANRRTIELEPYLTGPAYNNIGFTYLLMDSAYLALEYFKKSQKLRTNYSKIDLYMGRTFWMMGELDSSEIKFKLAFAKSENVFKAYVLTHLVSFYYSTGQLDLAEKKCEEGINICKKENKSDCLSYFYFLKGEIQIEKEDTTKYLQLMNSTEKMAMTPFLDLALVGFSYAEKGFNKKAKRILNRIEKISTNDPHFNKRKKSIKNYINGHIELNNKNYKTAKQILKKADKIYSGDPIYFLTKKKIAETEYYLNKNQSLKTYNEVLDSKGEIFLSHLPEVRNCGLWISELWIDSNIKISRLYFELGDKANSIKHLKNVKRYMSDSPEKNKKLTIVNKMLFNIQN